MAVGGVGPRTPRATQNPSASTNRGAIVITNPNQGIDYTRATNSPTKGRTSASMATQDSKAQLSAAKNQLDDLVREEKVVLGKIKTILAELKQLREDNPGGVNNSLIIKKQKELTEQYTRLSEIKNLKAATAKLIKEFTSSVAEAETTAAANAAAQQPTVLKEDKSAKMNLSACKDLYFRGTEQFMAETKDISANAPGKPAEWRDYLADTSYKTAEKLWGLGVATKGRIQTFVPPSTAGTDSKATKPKDSSSGGSNVALGRRMFQFHYNPGSVTMTYGSVSGVDLGLIASGGGLSNVYSALGQVQFELLVNRMPDMKYIKPNGNYRKDGVNYLEVYDRVPLGEQVGRPNELKEIYNKGTMYDIEFLLKILMGGVSYKSWLRGNELTSDLGFAIPQPVELHMGNRLRYVISVTNISLKHVIFNERMVPLFTTLSITANRIPADAIGTTNTDLNDVGSTQGGSQ
jgi:hypothetical protein